MFATCSVVTPRGGPHNQPSGQLVLAPCLAFSDTPLAGVLKLLFTNSQGRKSRLLTWSSLHEKGEAQIFLGCLAEVGWLWSKSFLYYSFPGSLVKVFCWCLFCLHSFACLGYRLLQLQVCTMWGKNQILRTHHLIAPQRSLVSLPSESSYVGFIDNDQIFSTT